MSKYLHLANMWILTVKNIYNQDIWGIHISSMRENIQNMWIEDLIYIYIYIMQVLAIISRQANNSTKREGVGRIGLCYHPHFSHFHHAKKMTNKAH